LPPALRVVLTDNHLSATLCVNGDAASTYILTKEDIHAALEKAGIICNKNTIPGETRSPFDPSGIRLGTPAETTRGKKEKDFINIARKMDKVLRAK